MLDNVLQPGEQLTGDLAHLAQALVIKNLVNGVRIDMQRTDNADNNDSNQK